MSNPDLAEAGSKARRPRINWSRVIFGVMILVIIVAVALDWNKMKPALRAANWSFLPAILLSTLLSYACSSSGYAIVNRVFGLPLSSGRLLLVGLINMATNNLLALGGVAGYSVSAVLMKREDIPHRAILAASLFNTFLYTVYGTWFLALSLLYLRLTHQLSGSTRTGLSVMIALSSVSAIVLVLVIIWQRFRSWILRLLSRIVRFVSRRNVGPVFDDFDLTLKSDIGLLGAKPGRLISLLALILGDWTFCIIALRFCFAALRVIPGVGVLLSGFFVGISVGAISMIPGGLGVQEGSMAGVYALLGIRFEQAALASILFRVVYYFIPFLFGLLVYWQVMRSRQRSEIRDQETADKRR